MTTESKTSTANEQLMGAEAEAREKYEACVAGTCDCLTHGMPGSDGRIAYAYAYGFVVTGDLTVVVGYHGDPQPVRPQWVYQFVTGERDSLLRGRFDSRESCLQAIAARMGVRS